ncbi:hypothetical protein ACIPLC_03700 [Kitasatospora sp. NPDC086801]|uniref:hypothetical protein n=1 Tax=Kitasatospora sp. NPDC086801 TaxID=3364066 RepID=UPI0037F11ED3
MGEPAHALDQDALTGFELDFCVDGVRQRGPLRTNWDVRFETVEPVREFSWHKFARGFAGWYYSATVGDHVGYAWVGRPDPVFMANVRWLNRYRRARCGRPADVADRLLEVFREPKGLWEGAGLVGDRLQVLPVLFHLLWSGALGTDLAGVLMAADSLVWTEGSG